MGVVGWIVVGLLAGGLARSATGSEKRGCLGTMIIGILGGIIGGALFNAIGGNGIGDFGLWSILVAFVGACVLLFLMQALGINTRSRGRR
jgi:uncharacterized membrane protein YeaQ/YmgE (transglycosylase-associated protein family)